MVILVQNSNGTWERWLDVDEIKKGPGTVIYFYTKGKLRTGLAPLRLEIIPTP